MSKRISQLGQTWKKVVDVFYKKIKVDEMLQHMFINVKWQKHLPVMYDFWEKCFIPYREIIIKSYGKTSSGTPTQGYGKKSFLINGFCCLMRQ